jgi:Ca2+/Na+ antiporter
MNPGLIGGILGSVIGIAGGLFGTYCSIKNTNGPRERAFMIKGAVICWVAMLVFLALQLVLPNLYRWLMWIPYALLLPLGIFYANRTQQRIRKEEAPPRAP